MKTQTINSSSLHKLIKSINKDFKWFFLTFYFLFMIACEDEPNYYPIPKILKEWGYYQTGSYWIYQNDSSMIFDSVFVTSVTIINDSTYSDKKLRDIYETLFINFYSSLRTFSYTAKLGGGIYSNLEFETKNEITKDRSNCTLLRISSNEILNTTSFYEINYLNSITLNNTSYSDVILVNTLTRYYYEDNSPNDTFYNQYWISKGDWIIKKVITNKNGTESWSLVRHYTY